MCFHDRRNPHFLRIHPSLTEGRVTVEFTAKKMAAFAYYMTKVQIKYCISSCYTMRGDDIDKPNAKFVNFISKRIGIWIGFEYLCL